MTLTPAERVRRWRAKKKLQQQQLQQNEQVIEQVNEKVNEVVIEKPIISTLRLRSYIPLPTDWTDYNSSNYLIIF
jgi:hypothetical protein